MVSVRGRELNETKNPRNKPGFEMNFSIAYLVLEKRHKSLTDASKVRFSCKDNYVLTL